MGQKIKYMGSSHIRSIPKGESFGGRLAEPTTKDLEFNQDNFWVIDTEDVELSEDAVALLLEDPEFKDVSEMKRIPVNKHQAIFQAMKSVSDEEEHVISTVASTVSDTGTTVGGSTAGAADTAATVGGSTSGGARRRST
jgi:hypothetical protein